MKSDRTFLVVASHGDAAACRFVQRYFSRGVRLMTPHDLSRPGWSYTLGDVENSTAVISGRRLAANRIGGVVTRLACISEHDLAHIKPADRAYVAAEMNAFLLAWLTALQCPMLNRPTPNCMSGQWWRHEQWVQTACRLHIPVAPVHQRIDRSHPQRKTAIPQSEGVTVTLVGRRHFGSTDSQSIKRAHALAEAAGVDLLTIRFTEQGSRAAFLDTTLWPDIAAEGIAQAVFEYLQGGNRCH